MRKFQIWFLIGLLFVLAGCTPKVIASPTPAVTVPATETLQPPIAVPTVMQVPTATAAVAQESQVESPTATEVLSTAALESVAGLAGYTGRGECKDD